MTLNAHLSAPPAPLRLQPRGRVGSIRSRLHIELDSGVARLLLQAIIARTARRERNNRLVRRYRGVACGA